MLVCCFLIYWCSKLRRTGDVESGSCTTDFKSCFYCCNFYLVLVVEESDDEWRELSRSSDCLVYLEEQSGVDGMLLSLLYSLLFSMVLVLTCLICFGGGFSSCTRTITGGGNLSALFTEFISIFESSRRIA